MSMPQRRRWERVRRQLHARVAAASGNGSMTCSTLDICEGGLGLLAGTALDVGGEYRITVPDLTPEPMSGTVRWCTALGDVHSMGIELVALTAAQAADLRAAVERWVAEDADRSDD